MTGKTKLIALLCALTAAVFCLCSCGADKPTATDTAATSESAATAAEKVGEGETEFLFTVTFEDGTEKTYDVSTNETTVGGALSALGIIEGEQGDYGLYVKTVDGVKADYDADGAYWLFTIDGEAAMTGVDMTDITAGSAYGFIYTKS